MSGFKSTRGPVQGWRPDRPLAIVEDLLYPHGSKVWGPKPGTRARRSASRRSAANTSRAEGPGTTRARRGCTSSCCPTSSHHSDAPCWLPEGSGAPADRQRPRLPEDEAGRWRRSLVGGSAGPASRRVRPPGPRPPPAARGGARCTRADPGGRRCGRARSSDRRRTGRGRRTSPGRGGAGQRDDDEVALPDGRAGEFDIIRGVAVDPGLRPVRAGAIPRPRWR